MSHTNYYSIIEYLTNLTQLPVGELEKTVQDIFSYGLIKKNERFLNRGDKLRHIGFNLEGIFRYYYEDYEGNDVTKYFLMDRGFILSLSSFITREGSLFTIEALEDAEILIAPIDKVFSLCENNPAWKDIYTAILEQTYVEKERREAEFLLCNAKDRYLHFVKEYPGALNQIRHHYIASYLGIAPETLSRIRSHIERS